MAGLQKACTLTDGPLMRLEPLLLRPRDGQALLATPAPVRSLDSPASDHLSPLPVAQLPERVPLSSGLREIACERGFNWDDQQTHIGKLSLEEYLPPMPGDRFANEFYPPPPAFERSIPKVDPSQGPFCISLGSVGHPFGCGPACKYATKAKGCKDGMACKHCHICRWTRRRA
mmetsp:Transcript_112364/g.328528  ORF Transcript_112364/g.328528 Transcript_112364/m.328528 type:complete len:173 (-) Transcript_112364:36-554(-)